MNCQFGLRAQFEIVVYLDFSFFRFFFFFFLQFVQQKKNIMKFMFGTVLSVKELSNLK